jgi:hypothetical protein
VSFVGAVKLQQTGKPICTALTLLWFPAEDDVMYVLLNFYYKPVTFVVDSDRNCV